MPHRFKTRVLNARLRLFGKDGDRYKFFVESVVVNDLRREFTPHVDEEGEFRAGAYVVFQRSESDPHIFRFLKVDGNYVVQTWLPFVPKKLRENANERRCRYAEEQSEELKQIFKNGDHFHAGEDAI